MAGGAGQGIGPVRGGGAIEGTPAGRMPAEREGHGDRAVELEPGDRDLATAGVERRHLVVGPVLEAVGEALHTLADTGQTEGDGDVVTAAPGAGGVDDRGRHGAGGPPAGDERIRRLAAGDADDQQAEDREDGNDQAAQSKSGKHHVAS